MTQRACNIRNWSSAHKAREYSWSEINQCFPRGVRPTDIDGATELGGHFLFLEFKTHGAQMMRGQRLFFERLLRSLGGASAVFLMEHDRLDRAFIPVDSRFLTIWFVTADGRIAKTPQIMTTSRQAKMIISLWADSADGTGEGFVDFCTHLQALA